MLDATQMAALLKRTELFRGLPARDLDALALAARLRRFTRGQFLCRAGEPARAIFVVVEGRVSISRSSWNGGRRSVEFMAPGDVFGLPALASLSYPNDIQARLPTTVAALPKENVAALVARVPSLAQTVFVLVAQRLQFVETMLLLANESSERRLATTLVYLRRKFGPDIPLSRGEVAEMAGVAPETAMRLLRVFEDAGWVLRRTGGVRVLDDAALGREAVDL